MFAILLTLLAGEPTFIVENKCPVAFVVENRCPAKTPHAPVAGLHTHRCHRCGTEWSHGSASLGRVADHTCPKCGAVEWNVAHAGGIAKPVTRPAVTHAATSNCPGGVCPIQSRPVSRPALRLFR